MTSKKKNTKLGEPTLDTLAERLTFARERSGLTQTQLGELSGNSQQTIQKIEGGDTKRPRKITAIADALTKRGPVKVSPAWLLFGMEELDLLDKDAVLLAIAWQSLPKHLKEGYKTAIEAASKINHTKPRR
jgi:transcriptional regulator with XRE-family HTH domain